MFERSCQSVRGQFYFFLHAEDGLIHAFQFSRLNYIENLLYFLAKVKVTFKNLDLVEYSRVLL